MNPDTTTETASLAEHIEPASRIHDHPNGIDDILVYRNDQHLKHLIVDEADKDTPTRLRGTSKMSTVGSFVDAVEMFKSDATHLYHKGEFGVIAVLNDSEAEGPGHGDHRVEFEPVFAREFKAWLDFDRKWKTQEELAGFLDDNGPSITAPTQAEMVELVRTFEATTSAKFKSGVRTDNGTRQLTYVEDVEASASSGAVEIPERILFSARLFRHMDTRMEFGARFEYKIREGNLSMRFVIEQLEEALEDESDRLAIEISGLLGRQIFRGSPVAPADRIRKV